MAGKSRSLSGIWVPVQLDTSKIEAQLSSLKDNFAKSIEGIQKSFDGALNTRKLANELVNIPKQIGYIKDAANALKTTESAFNKPIEGLKEIADAAQISEAGLKKLYTQMATNQAINQQVNALTQLQRTLGMTAQEAVRFAQANTQISSQAIAKFADKNQVAGYQQLTTELQKLAPQANLTAKSFDTLNKEFQEFQAKQASLQYIGGLVKGLGLDTAALKKYRAELNITEKQLTDYIAHQKMAASANRGVMGIFSPASVSSAATSGFAAFGVSLGAYGIAELAKSSYEAALQLENVQVAFNSVYKDANKADMALGFVRDTADELGLAFLNTTQAAKKMFAAAQGTELQEEVFSIFEAFSKAGVALRLSGQEMESVFLAISQMISKGKISAEELRLQLAERFPGAVQLFAKSMNVTTAELDQMLSKGQVGLENLVGFAKLVNETYAQGAAEASNKLQAELGRLSTSWVDLKAAFTDTTLAAEVVRMFTSLNVSIKEFQPQITEATKMLLFFGSTIASLFVVTRIAKGMSYFSAFFKTLALDVRTSTGAMAGLRAATLGLTATFPGLLVLSGILTGAYLAYQKFGNTTPILDASNALSKFGKQAEEVNTKIEDLTTQNLNRYKESLKINIKFEGVDISNLQKELDTTLNDAFESTLKGNRNLDYTGLMFSTSELNVQTQSFLPMKKLMEEYRDTLNGVEEAFKNAFTSEDIEYLKETYTDFSYDILLRMKELGASEVYLAKLEKGWKEMINSFSNISAMELSLRKANDLMKVTGSEVTLNIKDIENAFKELEAFTKDSNLSKSLQLDVDYENMIGQVQKLYEEFSKFENISESTEAQAYLENLDKSLAAIYSRAASSPSEMRALNNALDSIGEVSDESRIMVDRLRASLQRLSEQDINLRLEDLGLETVSNYFEDKLPKQIKDISSILYDALDISSLDVISPDTKTQIDALSKGLSEGLSFREATQGLTAFSHVTDEVAQRIQTGLDILKLYPEEVKKTTSATTKQSEAFKAIEELQRKSLEFQNKISDSEVETFRVTEQARQKEIQAIIEGNKGSAQEIALLKEKQQIYLQWYAQMDAFNQKQAENENWEKEKEDNLARATFYEDLGAKISDSNLRMEAFNESLTYQVEEWQKLNIPPAYIEQMTYLSQLEVSYDWVDGMKRGFNELANSAADFASKSESFILDVTSSMTSSFADFTRNGMRDFASFRDSVISNILDIAAQMISSQIFSGIFGGIFGGGSSSGGSFIGGQNFISGLFQHTGGMVNGTGLKTSVPTMAFAGAPRFHNGGGYFKRDEYPAVLQYGERVLNRRETQAYNAGSASRGVQTIVTQPKININNYGNDEVTTQTSTDNQGNMNVEVMIGRSAKNQIAKDKQFQRNMGIQSPAIRR